MIHLHRNQACDSCRAGCCCCTSANDCAYLFVRCIITVGRLYARHSLTGCILTEVRIGLGIEEAGMSRSACTCIERLALM
jgi:hypothetical protein